MSSVTDIYAKQLVPYLRLNLKKLGKPVPDQATLLLIATQLVEALEAKSVELKADSLMYAAFAYANHPAPSASSAVLTAVSDEVAVDLATLGKA